MEKISLSLVIITLNEETNIKRCIQSVPFAADIVVLDSGSTDKTKEIARSLGARVFDEPWRGFGKMKNRAVELAQFDWVLSLDADEALSEAAQRATEKLLIDNNFKFDAYAYPRMSYHLGRWIRHGGWYPDTQIRLFDRRQAHWKDTQVHEHIVASRVGSIESNILHWVFKDLSHQVVTNDKYSTLGADNLMVQGKGFSYFRLITKPFSKFFETYVFKLGFLDGLPGFIISVGASYSIFLKFAKRYELDLGRGDKGK